MLATLPLIKIADLQKVNSYSAKVLIKGELMCKWQEIDYTTPERKQRYEFVVRFLSAASACNIIIHTHTDAEDSVFSSYRVGDTVEVILWQGEVRRIN